jgi:hypothetical protein
MGVVIFNRILGFEETEGRSQRSESFWCIGPAKKTSRGIRLIIVLLRSKWKKIVLGLLYDLASCQIYHLRYPRKASCNVLG